MNELKEMIFIFLVISFSICQDIKFQEIETLVKTEFNVDKDKTEYFKYKLGETKGPIGLHFHLANLFTVKVSIFKSNNLDEPPFIEYFLFKEQLKEIDTSEFNDYVYIVISETYMYYYKDYITIYNPNEIIELKPNEPLTINNFFSNNLYKLKISSTNKMELVYNTFNTENNKRIITVLNGEDKSIDKGEESQYKIDLSEGEVNIIIENIVNNESDANIGNQDFSIIVYEKTGLSGFSEIIQNKISKTNYIYQKEQSFYYYTDITNIQNTNTINFKLFYGYYLNNNNTKFFTNIIYLDHEINESDLKNNIPTENKLPFSYEDDSDEYFRIYFHDEKNDSNYKYLLIKLDLTENEYYIGSKNVEISLGNEVDIINLKSLDENEVKTINKTIMNDIPLYFKLLLNSDEKYLLTSQNQDLTVFIKGDLLNENNEVNTNYLNDENEIVILSGLKELTVKIFGSTKNDIIFYVQKMGQNQLIFKEDKRDNQIFELTMTEEDNIKYIVGTYDYETYAYGEYPVNYYITYDTGEFEIYYKNKVSLEKGGSLFPLEESQSKEFNKRIILSTNLDLFTIKCKKSGTISIRPETKTFEDMTIHPIEQNSINEITLYDRVEIIQLKTLLGQNTGNLFFSVFSIDGVRINIIPDTPGIFEEKSIEKNELFSLSIDLSKYKMDQLAIRINSSLLENNIEVNEIIHNKYNTYQKLDKGDNQKIKLNNAYFQIDKDKDISNMKIIIENLENKKISYGFIKSASSDSNYLLVADKYPNTTSIEIKDNKTTIEINNIYNQKSDDKKPYLFLLVSILGEEDNLEYNINVEIKGDDNDKNKWLFIGIISLIAVIVLLLIILIIIICIKRRKKTTDKDKIEEISPQYLSPLTDS